MHQSISHDEIHAFCPIVPNYIGSNWHFACSGRIVSLTLNIDGSLTTHAKNNCRLIQCFIVRGARFWLYVKHILFPQTKYWISIPVLLLFPYVILKIWYISSLFIVNVVPISYLSYTFIAPGCNQSETRHHPSHTNSLFSFFLCLNRWNINCW